MPLTKRTLAEADPNAPSRPNPKILKKSADGEENQDANKWYETLSTDELKEICHVRGHLTTFLLQLQEGDKAGNPSEEELHEQFVAHMDARTKWLDKRSKEAEQELRQEGVKKPKAHSRMLFARGLAPEQIQLAEKGEYPMRYHEDDRTMLVEMCKLRGLSTEGKKAILVARLEDLDKKVHRHSDLYIETQKRKALQNSEAGKRAIEIEAFWETDKVKERDGLTDDVAVKVDRAKRSKELATRMMKKEVTAISNELRKEDTEISADVIGARLLAARIPKYATGGAPGYSKLRVEELRELLRLRDLSTNGMKVVLISCNRLQASDAGKDAFP